MNDNLYLHESILLLGIDDAEGHFTTSLSYLNYAFAAAMLMDLVLEERIKIEDKMVLIKTNAIPESKLLKEILKTIQKAKKPKKVSAWLHTMVISNSKYIKKAIDNLIKKDVLEKRKKKFLWIFNFSRYPTVNAQLEQQLRDRINKIIFDDAQPQHKEIMLLSIIQSCQMMKDLITDKEKRKIAREKIKELTEQSEIKKLIGDAIVEMETMTTVITTASI